MRLLSLWFAAVGGDHTVTFAEVRRGGRGPCDLHGICCRADNELSSARNITAGTHTAITKISGEQKDCRGSSQEPPPQREVAEVRGLRGGED